MSVRRYSHTIFADAIFSIPERMLSIASLVRADEYCFSFHPSNKLALGLKQIAALLIVKMK